MRQLESGRGIVVLHVDDDERFAELVAEYLQEGTDDITVVSAHDTRDALATLEAGGIDCVVSDYEMPRTDGLELLRTVRDRWPDLPFVLFTCSGDERTAQEAIELGVTDYLRKSDGTSQYALLANRVRDAVGRARAEEAVRLRANRTATQFELLVDTVEDYAIFLLDEDGYVRTWNRGAREIKGYAESEIVGEHFSVFYREEDVAAGVPERNLANATANDRVNDEGWRVRADGSEFWADVTITALRDDAGDLVGYAKVTRDITQAHQERALLEQNEQLRHLITSISHDLKNPLNVAEGNVELAADSGDLSFLDEARDALDRVDELLTYLTKLAKEGEQVGHPEPVALGDVAEESWTAVGGASADLTVASDAVVVANPHQFRQLLENLLGNARRHAGDDVRVEVGSLDDGIYVEDDGPGIPPDERGTVFEVGYTTAVEGTGFGLAICRQIAESNGSRIVATDAADGGARFEVTGMTFA